MSHPNMIEFECIVKPEQRKNNTYEFTFNDKKTMIDGIPRFTFSTIKGNDLQYCVSQGLKSLNLKEIKTIKITL